MTRVALPLATVLLLVATGCGASATSTPTTPASAAPRAGVELALRRPDGTFIDVGELRGRVVVLWLFATFDTTSQALLTPLTNVLEQEPEIVFIGVAVQPNARLLVDAYVHALRPPLPVTYDPEDTIAEGRSDLGEIEAIPTIMVLDATGRVAAAHTGFADEATLGALIARAR